MEGAGEGRSETGRDEGVVIDTGGLPHPVATVEIREQRVTAHARVRERARWVRPLLSLLRIGYRLGRRERRGEGTSVTRLDRTARNPGDLAVMTAPRAAPTVVVASTAVVVAAATVVVAVVMVVVVPGGIAT